jgi:tRNA-2-methylthio-N6-dimethylallyladenosine synthase
MKFYIETYGCQMNVADSEMVSSILKNAGYIESYDINDADIILFNTCSVRQHAENRILGRISAESSRKTLNPDIKIVVLGCMAQRVGENLLKEKGIDLVVGVDKYDRLPELLIADERLDVDFDSHQIYPGMKPEHKNATNAFVTIMRGCDNFCSYCIVPYVRGRERSVPFDDIYAEVVKCGESGLKEITLLGQNVNSYHYKDITFSKLMEKLAKIPSIYRLRFITSHPKDLSLDLIHTIADNEKISKHIHLPLQSGDDHVLELMNRKYTYSHYRSIVEDLRTQIPSIAITTDLIAGFPGETDAMFENTCKSMKEIEFDYSFCFKYSEREGTQATSMPDKIPENARLERLQKIIDIQREITFRKFSAKIGSEVEVYVEGVSKKSNQKVSGKTDDYKIAVLSGTLADIGTLKKARVVSTTAGTLICE